MSALNNNIVVRSDRQLQTIRNELRFLVSMITALDRFTNTKSRLTIIVDGLDVVEQRKVLVTKQSIISLVSSQGLIIFNKEYAPSSGHCLIFTINFP